MLKHACFLATLAGALAGTLSVASELQVAFGEVDITPQIAAGKPVWLAGYGFGRKATGVHDPIMARCVVLADGKEKIALVSVDLVGLQYPEVQAIRAKLPAFRYVLVSSTHNHEGPDVIGIWGSWPFHRGVDDGYLRLLVERVSQLVSETADKLVPAEVGYGMAEDETLLNDSRQPFVKDGVLRVLSFTKPGKSDQPLGLLVQWNCHPEALGSKNTLLTADFPSATVARLKQKLGCPIAFFSGAVGGLMAPPRGGRIKDAAGAELHGGDYEYARVYGEAVADLALQAKDNAKPTRLTPFAVSASKLYVPVTNAMYRVARAAGVLKREGFIWTGDAYKPGEPLTAENADQKMSVETEVACVRLGEVHLAAIPGELYPELVYGKFQEPAEANADYPDAPLEPTVANLMPSPKWLLFGLANDEIGYLIPKRQWDSVAPYAYGRRESQYGEINSCGPDAAPLVMEGLRRCVQMMK
jgi:hypothetical protein